MVRTALWPYTATVIYTFKTQKGIKSHTVKYYICYIGDEVAHV